MANNSVLETLLVELKADDDKLIAEFRRIIREGENSATAVEARYKRMGGTFTSVGTALSIGVTAPIIAVGFAGIRGAAGLETLDKSFTTLTGSAETAKRVLDDVRKFGAETPFEFPELADATRSLIAFGVEADTSVETLRRIGDVSSGVSAPIGEIAEIYGKARVQGRLFAEDINQLTGRGIPIIQELAEQFGVAEGDVRGLVESGQVGFPQIEQAFISMTSEGGKFFNLMAEQSTATAGKFSTLKDNANLLAIGLGERLLPTVNELVDRGIALTDRFGELSAETQDNVIKVGLLVAGLGPLVVGLGRTVTALGQLQAAWAAQKAAILPFIGAGGLFLAFVAGLAAVYAELAKSDGIRQGAAQAAVQGAQNLIDKLSEYRDALTSTSELERQVAEERLQRAQKVLTSQRDATQSRIDELQGRVDAYLERNPVGQALTSGLFGTGGINSDLKELEALNQELEIYNQGLSENQAALSGTALVPLPLIKDTPAGQTAPGGTPTNSKERTVADVFTDLNTEGTVAQQRAAALGNTLEANLESLQTRAEATNNALTEVFELGGSDAQVEYLTGRLADLNSQLEAVGEKPLKLTATASVLPERTILGEDESGIDRGPQVSAQVSGEPMTILGTVYDPVTGRAREANPVRAQVAAEVQVLGDAYDPATGQLIIKGPKVEVDVERAQRSQDPRGDIRQSYLYQGEFAELQGDLQGFSGTDEQLAGVRDRIQESYTAGDILLSQFRELLVIYNQLAASGPVDLITSPTFAGQGPSANVAGSVALLPGAVDPDTGKPLEGGAVPTVEIDAAHDGITSAGEQFRADITQAGLDFGSSVLNALADGKITGDEAAGIGGPLGTQLGSTVGGLFGSLVGGLFGGNQENDSRSQAAKDLERRNGASSITFNLFANQTNTYTGSPADPGVAAQFDRNLRKIVEEVLKQANLDRVAKKSGAGA